ncbi:SusC/RagA family TonB-linked outer membrane protein [Carboxylicivirga sediminis]|uniref:SusC/RagA family TonB-linked outer membrane protein n=1 Tax=Carboxylicivirga sediminis TaxID=2006564 RepID=A0A941IXA4_9BACT|nr:SusC/RagA family TonB-linked outer membrane protein [Carboxylicivirga sediminis]MBR8535860.1 SusC/RagA family TonB-linked outer membrane protein [Carboxylicivirga sediminis]
MKKKSNTALHCLWWAKIRKVMKLLFLLNLLCIVSISASTFSQKKVSSLVFKDANLKEVFDKIEKELDVSFYYQIEYLDVDKKISANFEDVSLDDVLNEVLKETDLDYRVINDYIAIVKDQQPLEQNSTQVVQNIERVISGKVTDINGEPLPGVNVYEKSNPQHGVITGVDGTYSISVATDNAMLVYSYIGFIEQELNIGQRSQIDVTLIEEVTDLDEVVVVGYGTQKKREVSGAVAQIKGDALEVAPVASMTNSLTGRLSGLFVTSNSAEPGLESNTMLIRGVSSLSGNDPLIVIDGVIGADGLSRLNPNEIESISVLKDAAAAIYGARAASGVILVTTKRGKNEKVQYSLSTDFGINSPIGLMKVSNGLEYATYLNRLNWKNSGWDPNYTKAYSDQQLADIASGKIPDYDWVDKAFNDTFTQSNTNFSVRGGNDKFTFFTSLRYLDQGSVYYLDEQGGNKQYNIRTNLDLKATKNLSVGMDISYRKQDVGRSAGVFSGSIQTAGLTNPLKEFYVNGDERYPAYGRFGQSPLAMNNAGYQKWEETNESLRLHFKYNLPWVKGMSVGGFGSAVIVSNFNKNWNEPWYWYSENPEGADKTPIQHKQGTTSLSESFNRSKGFTGNLNINYAKSVGNHNMDLLLQVEQQTGRFDAFSASNDDYLSSSSDQLNSGSSDRAASTAGGYASETARINYSGRVNYNYSGKYFLQGVFRYDGSERFAEGQRFGFFPGVSASWLASEEEFLQSADFISSLKLRGSLSSLGNDAVPTFNYLASYNTGGNTVVNGAISPGYVESGSANPNTTWEVHNVVNFGIDAAFFNHQLTLELDVFKDNVSNMLATPNVTIPGYLGISVPQTNIGTMENKGWESTLNFKQSINNDFNFSIGGTFTYAKNKILDIDQPEWEYEWQNPEGHPVSSALRYHAIGIFRTQEDLDKYPKRAGDDLGSVIIQDYNGDGEITSADQTRQYNSNVPIMTFGITGHVDYKNWYFDMLWQGSAGGTKQIWTFFSAENNAMAYFANHTYDPDHINAEWPAPGQGFHDNDFYFFKNDYIRLKTVQFGYDFPKQLVEKIGLNSLRLYVSGYNLLTFSSLNKYGITDPEQTSNLTWDYPMLRTVNFGLNLTF